MRFFYYLIETNIAPIKYAICIVMRKDLTDF